MDTLLQLVQSSKVEENIMRQGLKSVGQKSPSNAWAKGKVL